MLITFGRVLLFYYALHSFLIHHITLHVNFAREKKQHPIKI